MNQREALKFIETKYCSKNKSLRQKKIVAQILKKYNTEDFLFKVIDANYNFLREFKNLSEEFCTEAIKKDWSCLRPINNKTEALCLLAVKLNGYCLEYVPESLRTPKVMEFAIREEPSSIQFIKNPSP